MKKIIRKLNFSFEEILAITNILVVFAVLIILYSFYSGKEIHKIIGFSFFIISAIPNFFRYTSIISGMNFRVDNKENVLSAVIWMLLFSFVSSIGIDELIGITSIFSSKFFVLDLFFGIHTYLLLTLVIWLFFTIFGLILRLEKIVSVFYQKSRRVEGFK